MNASAGTEAASALLRLRACVARVVLLAAALLPPGLALGSPPSLAACPFCDGGPSGENEVRGRIFDARFWPRLAATLAPFPALAGLVAFVYFGPLWRGGPAREGGDSCR